MFLFNLVIGAL